MFFATVCLPRNLCCPLRKLPEFCNHISRTYSNSICPHQTQSADDVAFFDDIPCVYSVRCLSFQFLVVITLYLYVCVRVFFFLFYRTFLFFVLKTFSHNHLTLCLWVIPSHTLKYPTPHFYSCPTPTKTTITQNIALDLESRWQLQIAQLVRHGKKKKKRYLDSNRTSFLKNMVSVLNVCRRKNCCTWLVIFLPWNILGIFHSMTLEKKTFFFPSDHPVFYLNFFFSMIKFTCFL